MPRAETVDVLQRQVLVALRGAVDSQEHVPSKGGHDAPSTHCPITAVLSGPSHALTQWRLRTFVTHEL